MMTRISEAGRQSSLGGWWWRRWWWEGGQEQVAAMASSRVDRAGCRHGSIIATRFENSKQTWRKRWAKKAFLGWCHWQRRRKRSVAGGRDTWIVRFSRAKIRRGDKICQDLLVLHLFLSDNHYFVFPLQMMFHISWFCNIKEATVFDPPRNISRKIGNLRSSCWGGWDTSIKVIIV